MNTYLFVCFFGLSPTNFTEDYRVEGATWFSNQVSTNMTPPSPTITPHTSEWTLTKGEYLELSLGKFMSIIDPKQFPESPHL